MHVIRTEHGWFDGNLLAEIVELAPDRCVVVEVHDDRPTRIEHVIRKPRDIRPA